MFHNFDEIEKYVLENKIKKKIAVCGAHDHLALEAVIEARRKGIIEAVLIGDEEKILEVLEKAGESPEHYTIINKPKEFTAARLAIKMVKNGEADIPMKGKLQSSTYLMAIKDPVDGLLPEGNILSEATIFYYKPQNRLITVCDGAINMNQTVEVKKKIVKNACVLAKGIGYDPVKVATISILEQVIPELQSSLDAKEVADYDFGEDIIVEGPFAFDNAIDAEAAKHKDIESQVAGQAAVMLMPCIEAGNVFHKTIHFVTPVPNASAMCGAKVPVIFNSRTDSEECKYYSILIAIAQCIQQENAGIQ